MIFFGVYVKERGEMEKVTYLICLRIVIVNKMQKYINRIGQKTGMSKALLVVANRDKTTACVADNQNLNSGNLRMKGLNSSSCPPPAPPPLPPPKTPLINPPPPLLFAAALAEVGNPGSPSSTSCSARSCS